MKQLTTTSKFVEPQERSAGFKIKRVYDEKVGCIISKSIPQTFQSVDISKTLETLFSLPDFEKVYIDYNTKKDHECVEGVYVDFCCGQAYKSNELFQSNPLAIQIKLFTDDFEPCNPLQSKAGVHKITAFYFQIMNLPSNLLSKINNIYLVALSDAGDSKNEMADVDNVIETIVSDIKKIETKGIVTSSKRILKGTLACVSFDNLGGNNLFGFSGGFNANFYGRICTAKRSDCQKMVKENSNLLRKKDEYERILAKIMSSANLSLTDSKGIKSACHLNTLDNFHILSNMSVDLMHDVFEGSVGFLLEQVFRYIVDEKISTLDHLQNLVENYNYGHLWKKKVPSKLNIDKKNIGQNATQAYCLILHIPFILYEFKNQLKDIWPAVSSMLQIIRLLLSYELTKNDIKRLSELITEHLTFYQQFFNQHLKPKHHFLLHYITIILLMGPVVRFWCMRMEAKHRVFEGMVNKTKCFINIKKTLAYKHQELFFASPVSITDDIVSGKQISFIECENFDNYIIHLNELQFTEEMLQSACVTKSLTVNDRSFKVF